MLENKMFKGSLQRGFATRSYYSDFPLTWKEKDSADTREVEMDAETNAKCMAEARKALLQSFPGSFINSRDEFIAHMKANEYILLSDCETPEDIECKVLEWFSRAAFKSQPYSQEWRNRKFHEFMLRGINVFLKTNFSPEDMEIIYQKLGNRIRHELTVGFVENRKDIEWLENK